MTSDDFRTLALRQFEAVESSHMGKADFRVRGKIFATLRDEEGLGTLKLAPGDQQAILATNGACARPAAGAWGARGWTVFGLADVDSVQMAVWLKHAWAAAAPKSLVAGKG